MQDITEEMRQVLAESTGEEQSEIVLDVERIILDDRHYAELCTQAEVEYGGVILLNDYKYNDSGRTPAVCARFPGGWYF